MLNPTAVPMWTAFCPDAPGGLAALLEPLAKHGADLQFMLARLLDRSPGKGVVFVTPLVTPEEMAIGEKHGFKVLPDLHVVRVEGANEPGLMYLMARAIAEEKINMRAVSSLAIRTQFVAYLAFDTEGEAARARRRLDTVL